MTQPVSQASIQEVAADWFARLQGEPTLEDWTAFQTWLEADPEHAAAYEAVEILWLDLDDLPANEPKTAPLAADIVPLRPRSSKPARRGLLMGLGLAAAAAIVALALTPRLATPSYTDYATQRGETREIALADGSRLTLGSATALRVRLSREQRDVTLVDGEASFDIAHLENRPFVVTVGAREVRVLGTEFNILSHAGRLAVSVRRGLVAVSGGQEGTVKLTRGQQLVQLPGESARTREVAPDQAFAWKSGKLIYDRTPLAEVVVDLNRYVATPIRVDPSAASVTVSGVLLIDEEAAMVRRLELFAPIVAETMAGEVVLKAKNARR
ncbi:FecR domain-containing protein [Caulobacter segnis]|uniref:FecR family protein n=1 Tax=Caulobacter segnis TaxID=88688 RepID=UPI002865F1B2|nr:FecR domain-containing protein [Caulobacter segnis]MDR6625011.1 transmembrane sensor [Caulobacter segnis]